MPPKAAEQHHRRQTRLAALASAQAAGTTPGETEGLARTVTALQYTAAQGAEVYLDSFDSETEARVRPIAFAGVAGDGRSLLTLFRLAESEAMLQVMAATAVQDAGRGAVGAALTARPRIKGYVRMLTPPSCPRCAVLGGKRFKWNQGFQRHPNCNCIHVVDDGSAEVLDPVEAVRAGQVRGLSDADVRAVLEDGADLSRIVNASRTTSRAQPGRPTGARVMPDAVYDLAGDDRALAIALLGQYGFLT